MNLQNARRPWRRHAKALIAACCLSLSAAAAEPADSIVRRQLANFGITFTDGNSVELLMSGQEKFDHLFG